MNNAGISSTPVDLDGLISVLGENLYSSPSVAIRELIQNAQDACFRYKDEAQLDLSLEQCRFEIHIKVDSDKNTITISDNGSGLTVTEITSYLATIGAGYTRLLRHSNNSQEMVGYFGLGFLSAYVVANKVEVITTSFKSENQTWLFTSLAGKSYSIREVKQTPNHPSPRGTRVTLYLKSAFYGLSNAATIEELINKYCCLLHVPIFLNSTKNPLNSMVAPWLVKDELNQIKLDNTCLAFAENFENRYKPSWAFLLPQNELNLNGIIWFQDGSSYASSDSRNASIFVRNMYVTDEHKDILPEWAGFLGGVFESPQFQPTASRESLQKNEYFHAVCDFIKEQIILKLREIILQKPSVWREILATHGQALLGAAVCDERLFSVMKKQLKVPTSMGELTLPQIIRQSDGIINLQMHERFGFEEILLNAKMVPIVKGYLFAVASYVRQFGGYEETEVYVLGESKNNMTVLSSTDPSNEKLKLLDSLLCMQDEQIYLSQFVPTSLPILIIPNKQAMLKKRIENRNSTNNIGAAALRLAKVRTKEIKQEKVKDVYVNMENALIKALLACSPELRISLAKTIRAFVNSTVNANTHGDDVNDNSFNVFSDALQGFNDGVLAILDKRYPTNEDK